jgi:hypothetical protein
VYDENEPLHVYIQAESDDQIMKACSVIDPILDPYSQEHMYYKQMQKQAVAVMYGYQTDTACENCGEKHRTWACPLHIGDFEKVDVKCAICHDKSHPTIDCPEREKVDDTIIESELMKFLREVDEFKKNVDIPVLEGEIQADNIRNSILYTGKMPQIEHSQNDISINSNKITGNAEENVQALIKSEIFNENLQFPKSELQQQNINFPHHPKAHNSSNYQVNNGMSNTMPNLIQADYRLPIMPIVNNPNVIRSAPVNYMTNNPYMVNQNFNSSGSNNYYPYMPPINGIGYYPLNPNLQNAYTKNFNLISSNFQGKIPTNYSGMNMSPLLNFPSKNRLYDHSNMNNYNYAVNTHNSNNINLNQNMIKPQYGRMNMIPNINSTNPADGTNNHNPQNNYMVQTRYIPNAPKNDEEIHQPPEPEDEPHVNSLEENQNCYLEEFLVVNKEQENHDAEDIQIEKMK